LKDVLDVKEMLARRLVETPRLWVFFRQMEPQLYRFPAISPAAFQRALEAVLGSEPV